MHAAFPRQEKCPFPSALMSRIDSIFADTGLSRKGNFAMFTKIIVGLGGWLLSYVAIYFLPAHAWQFVLLYLCHALTHIFLLLNVGHDSNHHAVSRNKHWNQILSYVMDLCGVNSYMWRIVHHRGHHVCINVYDEDEAITGRSLFRFTPRAAWKPVHRFQHLYALPMYGLASLDYVLWKDFEYFFFPEHPPLRGLKHPLHEKLIVIGAKLLYMVYMLVLPLVLLRWPWWTVLLTFTLAHVVMGITTLIVFQTTHVIELTEFPRARTEYEAYVYHIFATTADYSTHSRIVSAMIGGLNHHVAHHLCPNVCHTHYERITRIVEETAAEYNIPYRAHVSIWQALGRHLALLKQLSVQPTEYAG